MNSAEMVGGLFGVFMLGCPAFYFLIRGRAAGPRSRRLANLALFCGLSFLFMPEFILGPRAADRSALFLASGLIRVAFGLVGLLLTFTAFRARRDGGVDLARPIIAAGFSLWHMVFGA